MKKRLNKLLCYLPFLWLMMLTHQSNAQIDENAVLQSYPFIRMEHNSIKNDMYLGHFYKKVLDVQTGVRKQVSIVHIGDSHLQADFFSGMVREVLQRNLGNAGRGLIFPYAVAQSNEPYNYKTSSEKAWKAKRVVWNNRPMPIGVSGYTIMTKEDMADIHLKVYNAPNLDYSFNEISLFHSKGDSSFDYVVFDHLYRRIAYQKSIKKGKCPYISNIKLPQKVNEVFLRPVKIKPSQHVSYIFGMILKNDQPGLIYHTIAANGATVYHYNEATLFERQFSCLKPDLVIISLGTNEALNPPFFSGFFKTVLGEFLKKIKKSNPKVDFLFTTPNDNYLFQTNIVNHNTVRVRNAIVSFCNQNNYAYWDFYHLMGGYQSIDTWVRSGLANPDRIHFKASGYRLQAQLFLNALYKSFKNAGKYYQ